MATPEIDRMERNLANRLNIFKDFATTLLLENQWNEDFIIHEFHRDGSPIRNGIPVDRYVFASSTEKHCGSCRLLTTCKTYGCRHFFCSQCVRVYVEANLMAGRLVFNCLRPNCGTKMAHSVFLNDISEANRDQFSRLVRFSYEISVPQPPNHLAARIAWMRPLYQRNRWILLPMFLMLLLVLRLIIFSGSVKVTSEFVLKM